MRHRVPTHTWIGIGVCVSFSLCNVFVYVVLCFCRLLLLLLLRHNALLSYLLVHERHKWTTAATTHNYSLPTTMEKQKAEHKYGVTDIYIHRHLTKLKNNLNRAIKNYKYMNSFLLSLLLFFFSLGGAESTKFTGTQLLSLASAVYTVCPI